MLHHSSKWYRVEDAKYALSLIRTPEDNIQLEIDKLKNETASGMQTRKCTYTYQTYG